jgi:pectin methylesterase-like acyl-CoA thioesterase
MNHLGLIIVIGCIITMCLFSGCVNVEMPDKKTLYVDNKGTKQYLSIQKAIDAASNGTVIIVEIGSYIENIEIKK